MENYLFYIGKSALAAGAFYLFFLALFQHQKHFRFNRIYLPVSLALSFIIPLITFTKTQYVEAALFSVPSMTYLPEINKTLETPAFHAEWFHYLFGIYGVGAISFLFYLMIGHAKAISIVKKSKLKKLFEIKVNITKKDVHPFSFFNKIVLSQKTLKNPNLQLIVEHENIHVKEKHTFDILFAEILFLLQWFNPFAWLIKDAIKNNLEYKTDQQLTKTHNPQIYQLAMVGLADKKGVAPFLTALNGSQLKNRIIMMKKKTENKYTFLKQLLVFPLLAVLVMGLSNREVKTEIIQAENQIEMLSSEKEIKGKVTGPNGDPVSGASIIVKGKTVGTITDSEGNYELELENENETVVFIMVGFEKIQIPVKEKNRIDVQFKEEKTVHVNTFSTKTFTNEKENKHKVSGTVIDERGDPIPGVNILVKDKSVGTISNIKGKYLIELDDKNETLVFGGEGYKWKQVIVNEKNEINVTLEKYKSFIKGTVLNENKEPIPGVSVLIKNNNKGTVTNKFGKYQISDDEVIEKLVFSKDGYEIKESPAKGKEKLNVELESDKIEERNDELNLTPNYEGKPILPDKINGIQVNGNQKNPPLYIVDGKEVENVTELDPSDIESIEVLKDKTATDLYGEKGKNGVICIETKFKENLNDKLIIVDGEEYDGEIKDISPKDIASIDVLKGRSAKNIYGQKGKNGAIIIHTKNYKEDSQGELPVVLNGKITQLALNEVDRDLIQHIKRIEPEEAVKKYGEKGKNGVFEVTSRNVYTDKVKVKSKTINENPLLVINGIQTFGKSYDELNPDDIKSVTVWKDKKAIELYGEQAKNGVIEVEMKPEKIDTELKLRKFIAKKLRYPEEARNYGMSGTASALLEIDKKGGVKIGEQFPDVKLEEVVVVAEKPRTKSAEEPALDLLEKETERVAKLLNHIEIEKFKDKTILVTVKFVLQE